MCHDPSMTEVRAGWYADPAAADREPTERYWDGYSWSHQVRRMTSTDPAAAEAQTYPARPYKAPSIPSTPDGQVLAGWWLRAAATAADYIAMVPLLLVVALPSLTSHWHSITTWWSAGTAGNPGGSGPLPTAGSVDTPPVLDPATLPGLVLFATLFAASVLYVVGFLRWKQATPGKLAAGLLIRRRETPGPLPWSTILRRVGFVALLMMGSLVPNVGAAFAIVALVDCLWPLWDPNKQALHDKVAGTNVVLRNS